MEFTRGSSVINFEDAGRKSELEFQDFGHGDAATLDTSDFNDMMSSELESENAGLLSEEKRPASFWEFSYYQSFFDVDTDQVFQRILWSMLPIKGRATYLDRLIRPTPDLYGPFWISTTLIVSIAISANIADYLMTEGEKKELWHYDFHKMSIVATAIYSYITLLPLAIWALMWYQPSMTQYTLLEILCVYGYSLFIYIPISILWLIQISWLQWMLVIIGATLSGLVLVHTFWPSVQDINKKIGTAVVCLIMLFHVLLASGFVLYFFQPVNTVKIHNTVDSSTSNSANISAAPPRIVSREIDSNNSILPPAKLPNSVQNISKNDITKRKIPQSVVLTDTKNVTLIESSSNSSLSIKDTLSKTLPENNEIHVVTVRKENLENRKILTNNTI